MTIDILELQRICEKYNKGPLDLRITFDNHCVKLDVIFVSPRMWRAKKAIDYQLMKSIDLAQFETLVDDFMDEFISEVEKKGEVVWERNPDEQRKTIEKWLSYSKYGIGKEIEEAVFKGRIKPHWSYLGEFSNGKSWECSFCGHVLSFIDGGMPPGVCPNCRREMDLSNG